MFWQRATFCPPDRRGHLIFWTVEERARVLLARGLHLIGGEMKDAESSYLEEEKNQIKTGRQTIFLVIKSQVLRSDGYKVILGSRKVAEEQKKLAITLMF